MIKAMYTGGIEQNLGSNLVICKTVKWSVLIIILSKIRVKIKNSYDLSSKYSVKVLISVTFDLSFWFAIREVYFKLHLKLYSLLKITKENPLTCL